MASEPAEPTTRQATNPRVGMFARVDAAIDAFVAEHGEDGLKLGPRTAARIAITTLDEAGLLADPERVVATDAYRAVVTASAASISSSAASLLAKSRAERDHAVADARQWQRAAEERNGLAREVADLRDELATAREETAAARDLAEMRAEDRTETDAKLETAVAERDERQARITDAVAKLKAADNLIVDWQPSLEEWAKCVSLIVHARAALVGDQGKHLGENQAESGGSKALTSGNSWANRDLDLSGAALRAVEEADDAAGDLP